MITHVEGADSCSRRGPRTIDDGFCRNAYLAGAYIVDTYLTIPRDGLMEKGLRNQETFSKPCPSDADGLAVARMQRDCFETEEPFDDPLEQARRG